MSQIQKASITEFADKNLDVIIDFAGAGKTTADAINTVGQYGEVVVVGMAKDKVRLLPALNIPMPVLEKAIEVIKGACV